MREFFSLFKAISEPVLKYFPKDTLPNKENTFYLMSLDELGETPNKKIKDKI